MSSDDDWALGQNEVDVRNEAGKVRNETPFQFAWRLNEEYIFACRNPEQAWIDESRAEAEREDTASQEGSP